jgi:prepilin-type N-terminal cleavage/methylation domain-containing protein
MSRSGFTLFEVLVAILVLTTGVVAMLELQSKLIRLGAIGRERGRAAIALESRADQLRAEARGSGCLPPSAGSSVRPDGIVETWAGSRTDGIVEILVTARPAGRSRTPDSVLVRFPCE